MNLVKLLIRIKKSKTAYQDYINIIFDRYIKKNTKRWHNAKFLILAVCQLYSM